MPNSRYDGYRSLPRGAQRAEVSATQPSRLSSSFPRTAVRRRASLRAPMSRAPRLSSGIARVVSAVTWTFEERRPFASLAWARP